MSDSFHRLLFTSNDPSSIAPPFQMNFSDDYLHVSADAFNFSPTYDSNLTIPRDNFPVMIMSASTEAGNEEEEANIKKKHKQSELEGEDGGDGVKEISKPKKKMEKKEKAPRFAFVTKSETDHLEDGYRWRKYGQKALKNSLHPRGYYRCTTQKCGVKKHVERSFQDPSMVITTYEGSHNHQLPGTLRGNVAAGGPSSHNPLNYPFQHTAGTTRSNDMSYYDQLSSAAQHCSFNLTPLQHLQFYR